MKKIFSLFCFLVIFLLISCDLGSTKDPFDNPSEDFIIECLEKVPNIIEIECVTEDNDPNGNLNKAGGYTACVYFSIDLIEQTEVDGNTVVDKGTDCGGCVEVYSNEEDANKRNDYLANFDGGIFASGSHTVVGTCVIRTSDLLTATQQKTLESNIIYSIKGENDSIVSIEKNSTTNINFNNLITLPDIIPAGGLYDKDCYGYYDFYDANGNPISEVIVYKIDYECKYYETNEYVVIEFDLYCDPTYFNDRTKLTEISFQIIVYDTLGVKIAGEVVSAYGNWNENIRITKELRLDVDDVLKGVKIGLSSYSRNY